MDMSEEAAEVDGKNVDPTAGVARVTRCVLNKDQVGTRIA